VVVTAHTRNARVFIKKTCRPQPHFRGRHEAVGKHTAAANLEKGQAKIRRFPPTQKNSDLLVMSLVCLLAIP
jgi:hypothetical protein